MREFKFRAWIKYGSREPGKMIYLDHFYLPDQAIAWADSSNIHHDKMAMASISNNDLMQYTGLKDKNNKDIYEGDLLKCVTGWGNEPQTFDDFVTFEQGMFGVKLKQHGNEQLKLTGFKSIEVIGNIHENPELLAKV